MPNLRSIIALSFAPLLAIFFSSVAFAADEPPKPDASKMPHMRVDVKNKQVWVECQALNPQMPLEFFCCKTGTNEHEAVLRSEVMPSHLHLGLLMIGLTPGEPVRYSKAADRWLPPKGPPLQISCEWQDKAGKTIHVPAYRMVRGTKSKKEMPPMTWIFAGSRMTEDKQYAADTTGYIVSIVNFDLTVIDIPDLASSANETLEWEYNAALVPTKGTKIWMIIEPAGKGTAKDTGEKPKAEAGATGNLFAPDVDAPAASADNDKPLSDVKLDAEKVKALRAKWEKMVAPKTTALREAAQAHYEVINSLRREQNRLIDEADRVQRVIDQLQKEYQDMTTPHPEGETEPK